MAHRGLLSPQRCAGSAGAPLAQLGYFSPGHRASRLSPALPHCISDASIKSAVSGFDTSLTYRDSVDYDTHWGRGWPLPQPQPAATPRGAAAPASPSAKTRYRGVFKRATPPATPALANVPPEGRPSSPGLASIPSPTKTARSKTLFHGFEEDIFVSTPRRSHVEVEGNEALLRRLAEQEHLIKEYQWQLQMMDVHVEEISHHLIATQVSMQLQTQGQPPAVDPVIQARRRALEEASRWLVAKCHSVQDDSPEAHHRPNHTTVPCKALQERPHHTAAAAHTGHTGATTTLQVQNQMQRLEAIGVSLVSVVNQLLTDFGVQTKVHLPKCKWGLSTDLGALDNQIRVLDIVASNVASCLEVLGTHVLQKRAQEAEAAVGHLQTDIWKLKNESIGMAERLERSFAGLTGRYSSPPPISGSTLISLLRVGLTDSPTPASKSNSWTTTACPHCGAERADAGEPHGRPSSATPVGNSSLSARFPIKRQLYGVLASLRGQMAGHSGVVLEVDALDGWLASLQRLQAERAASTFHYVRRSLALRRAQRERRTCPADVERGSIVNRQRHLDARKAHLERWLGMMREVSASLEDWLKRFGKDESSRDSPLSPGASNLFASKFPLKACWTNSPPSSSLVIPTEEGQGVLVDPPEPSQANGPSERIVRAFGNLASLTTSLEITSARPVPSPSARTSTYGPHHPIVLSPALRSAGPVLPSPHRPSTALSGDSCADRPESGQGMGFDLFRTPDVPAGRPPRLPPLSHVPLGQGPPVPSPRFRSSPTSPRSLPSFANSDD